MCVGVWVWVGEPTTIGRCRSVRAYDLWRRFFTRTPRVAQEGARAKSDQKVVGTDHFWLSLSIISGRSRRCSEEREGSLDGFGGFWRCFESSRSGRGAVARRARAAWMVLEALGGVFESLRAGRGAVARRERAAWMVLEAFGGVLSPFGPVVAL